MSIRASVFAQRLNERVWIERATRDANGDISGWSLLVACRAAVDGAKARDAEAVIAGGTRSMGGYTVWVRSDIVKRFEPTVADRVVWGSRYLDVKDAPGQGLPGRLIALICEAGANKG
jgi:head-tail adaptor